MLKNIETGISEEASVELDIDLTPELEAEGFARNTSRNIQSLRKKAGLVKEDNIETVVVCSREHVLMLKENQDFIIGRTNSKKILITDDAFKVKGFTDGEFKMKDKVVTVKKYYKYVDNKEIDKLLDLFSDDIIYIRSGKEIKGMKKFKEFYKKERRLKGKHKITKIIDTKEVVITRGEFKGKNAQNNKVKVGFADFFQFNNKGKINRRETYLSEGYRVIK